MFKWLGRIGKILNMSKMILIIENAQLRKPFKDYFKISKSKFSSIIKIINKVEQNFAFYRSWK